MIFAAGHGKRMGSLTAELPKPLLPLAGKPMIEHILKRLPRVDELVLNVHHKAEAMQRHFDGKRLGFPVRLLREPEILGTGGGLLNAMGVLGGSDFIAHNCDLILDFDRAGFSPGESSAGDLLLFASEGKEGRGLVFDAAGRLKSRYSPGRPARGAEGETLRDFCGVSYFSREAADFFRRRVAGRESLVDSFLEMSRLGFPVKLWPVENRDWLEVGTREQYERVTADEAAFHRFF